MEEEAASSQSRGRRSLRADEDGLGLQDGDGSEGGDADADAVAVAAAAAAVTRSDRISSPALSSFATSSKELSSVSPKKTSSLAGWNSQGRMRRKPQISEEGSGRRSGTCWNAWKAPVECVRKQYQ